MSNGKKSELEKKQEKKKSILGPEFSSLWNRMDEMERMFENVFPRGWLRPARAEFPHWAEMMAPLEGRLPRIDVIDQENTLLVKAEVPGFKKEDIEVSLSGNLLTINGQTRKETSKEEKGKYQRREIYQGSFSRSIALPVDVDAGNAKAKFKDGMLELSFPKLAAAKRRSIKIED